MYMAWESRVSFTLLPSSVISLTVVVFSNSPQVVIVTSECNMPDCGGYLQLNIVLLPHSVIYLIVVVLSLSLPYGTCGITSECNIPD